MRVLMSEVNIQSQLLRDQDMRSLREREIQWMTEFRMMVNLSREISCKIRIILMMVSWRVKEESDWDESQSKS